MTSDHAITTHSPMPNRSRSRDQRRPHITTRRTDVGMVDLDHAPLLVPEQDPDQLAGHGRYGNAY